MRDEVLLQLARHPPKSVNELRGLRGIHFPRSPIDTEVNYWPLSHLHWRFHRRHGPRSLASRKPDPESTGKLLNSCRQC